MDDDEHLPDFHFAAGHDVILETGVPDKLRIYFRGVFHFVKVISGFRFAENIDCAVVVVVAERGFTDHRGSGCQVLLSTLQHGGFIRYGCARTVNGHLLIRAEHAHRQITEIIPRIQLLLDLGRNYLQAGLVLVQPEHLRALHAAHKISFCDRHFSANSINTCLCFHKIF